MPCYLTRLLRVAWSPKKKAESFKIFFWRETEFQTNRGQTVDNPWNDLLGSWKDLIGSWKDLLEPWTPPPSESTKSSKIQIFKNCYHRIWYAMGPWFVHGWARLQLRVVQKNSIVHFWMQHGCSSLKVRPRHGWVRWIPSSSIYIYIYMKSTNQHILNVRALGQKAFVFLYHAFLILKSC